MILCFFVNDTATTEIYPYLHTLSLHDALPISLSSYALAAARHMHQYGTTREQLAEVAVAARKWAQLNPEAFMRDPLRSEEHTSELQSLMRISYAVFCLKKKKKTSSLQTATSWNTA